MAEKCDGNHCRILLRNDIVTQNTSMIKGVEIKASHPLSMQTNFHGRDFLMVKYSEIHYTDDDKQFGFRYNYEKSSLEYVSKWDCDIDENGNLVDIELPDWAVTDSIGLNSADWEESPEYWIEQYRAELDAEIATEVEFFEQGL